MNHTYVIELLENHIQALDSKINLYSKKIEECTVDKPQSLDYFQEQRQKCYEQQVDLQTAIQLLKYDVHRPSKD